MSDDKNSDDKNKENKSWLSGRGATLVLLALVTVFGIHVVVANTNNVRLDLTTDDLYSLTEGTTSILDRMNAEGVQPIEMKLYFSETAGKTLPQFIKDFITYERYLRSLLGEYERESEGKIRVSFIDPIPDSDDAQDALDYGLDGKAINQYGDAFFFGLVLQTQTGSRDVIEFLWPNQQETVEYEITKKLHGLIWPTRKRIGVMSSLEVLSSADNPYMAQILAAQGKNPGQSWIAMQLLEEQYEVSKIEIDTDLISRDDYDLVVVIHPKNVSPRGLWALDEWIARGGNTLIFIDPFALSDQAPQNPQQPWAQFQYKAASNLGPLLERWGLQRVEDAVAVDFDLAVSRPTRQGGPSERVIFDLQYLEENVDETLADHPVFQGLTSLRFFIPGQLQPMDEVPEGVTLTPLVTTTAKGSTVEIKPGFPGDEDLVFTDLNDPRKVLDRYTPGSEPVVLAYQVTGQLPLLYPEGADLPGETPPPPPGLPPGFDLPQQPAGEGEFKEPVSEDERAEATVMVFADVDFISDQVAFQNSFFGTVAANDNHTVLLNAVDYLFGSEELMKVRAKKPIERPFTLFDEIEEQADRDTLEREKTLRAEIEGFQEELQEKQSQGGQGANQALFKKQLQDEVDLLNERIADANRELREIRKQKRAALEGEEARVRFATLGVTPTLVLMLGLFLFFRRRARDREARAHGARAGKAQGESQ